MADPQLLAEIKIVREAIKTFGAEIKAALTRYDYRGRNYVFRGSRAEEQALESEISTKKRKFLAAVEPLSVTIQAGKFSKEITLTASSIMNECLVLVNTPTIPTLHQRAFVNWLEGASAKDQEGIFTGMEEKLKKLEMLLQK